MDSSLVPVSEKDYLDQDLAIRGQKYVCISFVSPEDVLVKKDAFLARKFLSELSRDLRQLVDGLRVRFAEDATTLDMLKTLEDRYDYLKDDVAMQNNYDVFVATHPELDDEFHQEHGFQTSIRGFKVRGSYESIPEAENRVKQIQKFDSTHNVYIAEVGCWCPWAPRPEQLSDQVYAETELNTLMKKYQENILKREEAHEIRKKLFNDSGKGADEAGPSAKIEEV